MPYVGEKDEMQWVMGILTFQLLPNTHLADFFSLWGDV